MLIKRIAYPHTGIFQRKVKQLKIPPDVDQDFIEKLEAELAAGESEGFFSINRIESEARDFLSDYIKTDMGGSNEALDREMESTRLDYVMNYVRRVRNDLAAELKTRLSEEQKRNLIRKLSRLEQADDACLILLMIRDIRLRLTNDGSEQKSIKKAIAEGFRLGSASERFKVRSYEKKAFTGQKI